MKNITWQLLFQFLLYILRVSCNDLILSKFHQNTYKLRDVRAELKSYNENYYDILELKTFKYNRTTPAMNGTLRANIAVKDKIEVVVQAQKFLSNEYRHFPLRFQTNLQKAFAANALGLQKIKDCGNVTSFYFEKDVTYYGCNFVIDETKFPPLIPDGKYRIDLQMMYLKDEIAFVCVYMEVYTPIAYPKN